MKRELSIESELSTSEMDRFEDAGESFEGVTERRYRSALPS